MHRPGRPGAVRAGGGGALLRRLLRRAHPQPLRPLQPGGQVHRPAGGGRPAGHPVHRHRPLCPGGGGPRRRVPHPPAPERRAGPELYAQPPGPGRPQPADPAPGRVREGRRPGNGPGLWPGLRRHPRQHGDLFHPRRGLRRLHRGPGPDRQGRAVHLPRRGRPGPPQGGAALHGGPAQGAGHRPGRAGVHPPDLRERGHPAGPRRRRVFHRRDGGRPRHPRRRAPARRALPGQGTQRRPGPARRLRRRGHPGL